MTPPPAGTRIRRREAGSSFDRATGSVHRFVFGRFRSRRLEVEDAHFNLNSAVLLPDAVGADDSDQNHVTGLGVLRTAYLHAQRHDADRLLVAGHTDRLGSDADNLTLSRRRSANVLHLLLGDRDAWAASSQQQHKNEDIQEILAWVDRTFGWGCHPGPVTAAMNDQTRAALRAFKTRYNTEFDPDITVTGSIDVPTWKAFFDLYFLELKGMLRTDDAGLATLRSGLRFVDDGKKGVGCGEHHPVTAAHTSRVDRRVELLFFDAAELPLLDCHPSATGCVPGKCEIYPPGAVFDVDPIPADDWTVLPVHLRLQWKGPDESEHDFPPGFPVIVVPGGGGAEINAQVGADGRLTFSLDRRLGSFTLRFETANAAFITSPPGGVTGVEEMVFEPELAQQIRDRRRFWKLPAQWSLRMADWAGPTEGDATTAVFASHEFTGLDDASKTVGKRSAPVRFVLDPHWQFLRLTYFDRFHKRRISIPRSVVEGFLTVAAGDATDAVPDTVSNWTVNTDEDARQCLPWVVQRDGSGAAAPKPDGAGMLRYRSMAGTFIESSAPNTRRLVTVSSSGDPTPASPFINAGLGTSVDLNIPNADRLRFYDLPEIWKSRGYFGRLTNAAGPGPVADNFYDQLATQPTSDERPLSFSLDDIVLFEGTDTGALSRPLPWNGGTDRLALFVNTFAPPSGTVTSDPFQGLGLYKPDTAGNLPFLSERVADTANRNYVADYPDWVRLVVTGGNLFDCFDRRTPDAAGQTVGARAAVRFVDLTPAGVGVAPGAQKVARSPTAVRFFVVQPLFDAITPYASPDRLFPNSRVGRFDIVLLRCCDADGTTEIALNLHYFRFAFTFTQQAMENGAPVPNHAAPANLAGPVAAQFQIDAIGNTLGRWNGQDGRGGGVDIVPATGSALRVMARWFAQALPTGVSHFLLRVYLPDTRAFMGSFDGDGEMGLEDNPGAWVTLAGPPLSTNPDVSATPGDSLVIAHEAGHGNGLTDEYTESSRTATYLSQPGIYSFSPGSPYDSDGRSMMLSNRNVRARHFWHAAEWVRRQVPGNPPLQVRQRIGGTTYDYRLPPHPTLGRHYTTEPWHQAADTSRGTRGRYDAFLYTLSQDEFSHQVMAGGHFAGGAPADAFDGILIIVVKLRVRFHEDLSTVVRPGLVQMTRTIQAAFNDKWMASGTARGRRFERCLLHFAPRYVVRNYPGDASDATFRGRYHAGMGITNQAGLDSRVSNLVATHGIHFRIRTAASGTTAWQSSHLRLVVDGGPGVAPGLETAFGEMLGIDGTPISAAASFVGVAQAVLSDCRVVAL